ncbi:MAG: PhoH family protein [Thermoanaerobaculia bacterium]|nr:MAG: PhoH family protein [Thermoanaerobaculia bacterium]MBZ0102175.1 PhoH family protein [Thermoanaerobaculia bacterium]
MPRRPAKIFVLDTSVILYDANAIFSFKEHDVAVPITVLEELDQFKKGDTVVNLQAREFIRHLDKLSSHDLLQEWIPLDGPDLGRMRVVREDAASVDARQLFGSDKNDHRILNATLALTEREASRDVILVSKDINLRIKARALNLRAEDYETVRVKDVDHLYCGKTELDLDDPGPVQKLYAEGAIPPGEVGVEAPLANHYYILKSPQNSALVWFNPTSGNLERVHKTAAYGISPRNAEQTFALHAILNHHVPLVSISGKAGTGKTLLALAGALERRRDFRQIYLARPLVPLSNKDIGYLPGDIKSKINPYMAPLWDNLSVIKHQFEEKERDFKRLDEMVEAEKLHITPLAYIRGRSFSNIMFIVDEAQNLTPHEVRTIITRAGEGTKMIFTGDIFQIDTPYLDAQSNGLSYLIDRVKGNRLYAHVNLDKGERSELANLASMML